MEVEEQGVGKGESVLFHQGACGQGVTLGAVGSRIVYVLSCTGFRGLKF